MAKGDKYGIESHTFGKIHTNTGRSWQILARTLHHHPPGCADIRLKSQWCEKSLITSLKKHSNIWSKEIMNILLYSDKNSIWDEKDVWNV